MTYSTFPLNTSATFPNEITEETTVLRAYETPVYKKIVKNVRIQFKPAANAYDVPTKSWATTGSFTILAQFLDISILGSNLTDENVSFCNQTKLRSKWFMLRIEKPNLFTKFSLYIEYKGGRMSESF